MEYVVFFAAFGLLAVIVFIREMINGATGKKQFKEALIKNYGKLPEREYSPRRFLRICSYFDKHPAEGQIDDITWNDLDMDEIFKRMNHTLSSTGEEYLYYTLRTPKKSREEMAHQELLTEYFSLHQKERIDVQLEMNRLGGTGEYSLYDYLDYLDVLGERSNVRQICLDALLIPLIVLCFYNLSAGICGIIALLVYNLTTYFKVKKEIGPYITSFAYVIRLLDTCDRLVRLPIPVCEEEWETIREVKKRFARMKSGSFWVLSGGGSTGAGTGNPLEIIMDYVRMMFHVDIMVFNRMLHELNRHLSDIDILIGQLGLIETAICIGAYRESLKNGWCQPVFTQEKVFSMEEGYHPLIGQPVKNSVRTERGVLLTGSNASGKSTFLKTAAINALLAQTINTCAADRYEAPFYRIFSSMALRDDLGSGESYYIVEIKALKRILDGTRDSTLPVLCFVDEVLRGTNTVERIAASTQILRSLAGKNLTCFAATHDIELTWLLELDYDNYHFEEEIRDGDIFFQYKLLSGRATTRNAIRLLQIMGYDDTIIQNAMNLAAHFMESGSWE